MTEEILQLFEGDFKGGLAGHFSLFSSDEKAILQKSSPQKNQSLANQPQTALKQALKLTAPAQPPFVDGLFKRCRRVCGDRFFSGNTALFGAVFFLFVIDFRGDFLFKISLERFVEQVLFHREKHFRQPPALCQSFQSRQIFFRHFPSVNEVKKGRIKLHVVAFFKVG